MKRRNKRNDLYRTKRKKILRMKHQIWKRNGGRWGGTFGNAED